MFIAIMIISVVIFNIYMIYRKRNGKPSSGEKISSVAGFLFELFFL